MDFTHNGKDPSKFIEKAKKQAKRIFQLSKTVPQNSFEVKSLSDAQQLLAKINGFPDWHAMNTYVLKEPSVTPEKSAIYTGVSKVDCTLPPSTYPLVLDRVKYRDFNDKLESCIVLDIVADLTDLLSVFNSLKDELEFTLNLKHQELNFTFIQKRVDAVMGDNAYALINVAKEFNISEQEAMSFLVSESSNGDNKKIALLLNLSTNKKSFENYNGSLTCEQQHLNFCNDVMKIFNIFKKNRAGEKSLNNACYLSEDPSFLTNNSTPALIPIFDFSGVELKSFLSHFKKVSSITDSENEKNYEVIKRVVFFLNYLMYENINIKIVFNLNGDVSVLLDEKHENKLKVLKEAFIQTNRFPERVLKIISSEGSIKKPYSSGTGLAFKSVIDDSIFRFNLPSDGRAISTTGIVPSINRKKEGQELLEWVVLERNLNSNNKEHQNRTVVMGENYDADFFKKKIKQHLRFKVLNFDCSSKMLLPNIFVTPLGLNYINDEMSKSILECLKFFNKELKELTFEEELFCGTLLQDLNLLLEKHNNRTFVDEKSGFKKITSSNVSKISYLLDEKTFKSASILNVVRELWNKNEISLARALQNEITIDAGEALAYLKGLDPKLLLSFFRLSLKSSKKYDISEDRLLEIQKNIIDALSIYKSKVERDKEKSVNHFVDFDYEFVVLNLNTNNGSENFDFLKNYLFYLGTIFCLKSGISLPPPLNMRKKMENETYFNQFVLDVKRNWVVLEADKFEDRLLYDLMNNHDKDSSFLYTASNQTVNLLGYTTISLVDKTSNTVHSDNLWNCDILSSDGSIIKKMLKFNTNNL